MNSKKLLPEDEAIIAKIESLLPPDKRYRDEIQFENAFLLFLKKLASYYAVPFMKQKIRSRGETLGVLDAVVRFGDGILFLEFKKAKGLEKRRVKTVIHQEQTIEKLKGMPLVYAGFISPGCDLSKFAGFLWLLIKGNKDANARRDYSPKV